MNNPGFILIIDAIQNAEEINQHRLHRRQLRDASDPLTIPENTFRGVYRVSRQLAQDLINTLYQFLPDGERNFIPCQLKVLTALHFYAQGSYQKAVGQDYSLGLSQSSVSRCITDVNTALENLYNLIKFPTTDEECQIEKQGFMNVPNGFPGIIGAIDCTQIAIVAPPTEDRNYPGIVFLNRKGFYSINVQIVCNSNLKILAVNARYPGSVHDSAIWTTSIIRGQLELMHNTGNHNSWLLGDSGYPLEPWLITPFNGHNLTEPQRRFNVAHKSIRNVIERLNGVLIGRFRCLLGHRVLHYNPPTAAKIVNSCAVLHNLCLMRGEELPIDNYDGENFIDPNNDNNNDNNNVLHRGRNQRDRIVRLYFQN